VRSALSGRSRPLGSRFSPSSPDLTTSTAKSSYTTSPHQLTTIAASHQQTQNRPQTTSTMFKRVLATAPAQASRALQSTARPITSSFARTLTPTAQPARRSYHEKVLDHYNNPRNVGSMGKNQQDVGTGLVGAPACGDVMKIQIKVDPKNDTITDVKFKTFGCGSAIASSSYLTELVKGMTLEQASRIRNTEIAKELCLPPVKRESS